MKRLITVSDAAQRLGVTKKTLQVWDNDGKLIALRTAGGHRRYRQPDIEKLQGTVRESASQNQVAVYARVSSQDQKQKGDLDRQKVRLLEHCAVKEYKVEAVLVDVCSGMKAKRPHLKKLFKLVADREINLVVIEYKKIKQVEEEIGKSVFTSGVGYRWENSGQGCLICSI